MKRFFILSILVVSILFSCKNKKGKVVDRDTTITKGTSFNNLFFDSTQLAEFISSDSSLKIFEEQLFNFYKQRNYEYAWFDNTGLSEQAYNFYNLLNTTANELKDNNLINPRFLLF